MGRMAARQRNSIDYEPAERTFTQRDVDDFARAYDEFFRKRQLWGDLKTRTDLPRERPEMKFPHLDGFREKGK